MPCWRHGQIYTKHLAITFGILLFSKTLVSRQMYLSLDAVVVDYGSLRPLSLSALLNLGRVNFRFSHQTPSNLQNTGKWHYLKKIFSSASTGRMGWMAHRKWKEAKQLPGTAGSGNMLGCSLIFFHFLWAIHPIRPVLMDLV